MPPSMLNVVGLVDANGVPYSLTNPLPTSAGGGGGAVTVADGADIAQGATTDASSALTINGLLKNIKAALAGSLTVTGSIAVSNFPATQVVSGTVTITPSGTQTVTGTVTANVGTTGGLALDATLTDGTQQTKLTDGTNAAAVVNTTPTTQYGLVVRRVPDAVTAPSASQLSDGSASYVGAKTGQLPATLGQTTKALSLSVALASDQAGTAGTASATVLTVQGATGMNPVRTTTQGSTGTYITTATSTSPAVAAAVLRSLHIMRGNATATVTVYNAASGTTNKIAEFLADNAVNVQFGPNGLACPNGITIATTAGAGIISVLAVWDLAP